VGQKLGGIKTREGRRGPAQSYLHLRHRRNDRFNEGEHVKVRWEWGKKTQRSIPKKRFELARITRGGAFGREESAEALVGHDK